MTRASIREYTEAVRKRYLLVSKAKKGKILDEFTKCLRLYHIRMEQNRYFVPLGRRDTKKW